MESKQSWIATTLSFLFHQVVSTVGVVVLSALFVTTLFSISHLIRPSFLGRASLLLTETPGFPVQVVLGLALGFVLGKLMYRRVMMWVWVLPLAILIFAIVFEPRSYSSLFAHFLGGGCSPSGQCFDQLLFTLPCFASAFYAVGAKLARRVGSHKLVTAHRNS
jgi:hypothetical protein